MIFVSPDEQGRVVKLNVREGDHVEVGAPLYAVDDDLQQADLNQSNATLANAQQAYDRAAALSKTGSGTQANYDTALANLRVAEARVNTSQTKLERRRMKAPIAGTIQQIYFREGETVAAQRPVISILPPGNIKVRFFVPEPELPTMNLEGFTMRTPESEFLRVVRHEAGHTLGFEHEHMRTQLVQRIDRKKAIAYFRRTDTSIATISGV